MGGVGWNNNFKKFFDQHEIGRNWQKLTIAMNPHFGWRNMWKAPNKLYEVFWPEWDWEESIGHGRCKFCLQPCFQAFEVLQKSKWLKLTSLSPLDVLLQIWSQFMLPGFRGFTKVQDFSNWPLWDAIPSKLHLHQHHPQKAPVESRVAKHLTRVSRRYDARF